MPFLIRPSRCFPVCGPGTRFGVRWEKMYRESCRVQTLGGTHCRELAGSQRRFFLDC